MSTKLTGDISEYAFFLECLRHGYGISVPIGDRLPYDAVVDNCGSLYRVQIKTAWPEKKRPNSYIANVRRAKTNRKKYKYDTYNEDDFDVFAAYIQDHDVWYLMPISVFLTYKSGVYFVESDKRQKNLTSYLYREDWSVFSRGA